MLRSAFRTPLCPPLIRQYVSQAPHPIATRNHLLLVSPRSLLLLYARRISDPTLTFVQASRNTYTPPQSEGQPHSLIESHIPPAEYQQWASVLTSPTMASALDVVDHILASSSSDNSSSRPTLPQWALLSLLLKVPSTQREVFVAHQLVFHHSYHPSSPQLIPLTISLAAYWLIKFRMYAPLRSLILRLVNAHSFAIEAYQLALLLRILAQAPSSTELSQMIVSLLDAAIKRNFDLGIRTYRAILENKDVTSAVATKVQAHMQHQGFTPNHATTRAFVRIFGNLGRRGTAARYWRHVRVGEYYGPKADYANRRDHQALMLEETLRAMKKPAKLDFYIRYLLKNAGRAEVDPKAYEDAKMPRLPSHTGLPRKVFLEALRMNALDRSVKTGTLLTLLRAGLEHLGVSTFAQRAYFVVIKGMLKRREYNHAAKLLSEIWDRRATFDNVELTIAIEVLTLVNRPDAALRLLLARVYAPSAEEKQGLRSIEVEEGLLEPRTYVPGEQQMDVGAVNGFMISLLRIGRPDAVFLIWDIMPTVFRVEPDSISLGIMIKAARFARKCEGALQVAIADFGLGNVIPKRFVRGNRREEEWEKEPYKLGREDAIKALEGLLDPKGGRVVDGFWRGERAGVVALRIAWQVFLKNWPILKTIEIPMHAVRRSAQEQTNAPMSDLFHSLMSDSRKTDVEAGRDNVDVDMSEAFDKERGPYFSIVPEDPAFLALFDLLAEEDRATQIPLVLAWMRFMKVQPSKDTLACALMHWGEITFEGPLIERLKGNEGAFVRLLNWLKKWVGKKNMPSRGHTQKALRRLKWFREMRTFRTLSQRKLEDDWSRF